MPIDFTLNDNQRRLRREACQFAKDVLSGVPVATRDLPSPIERFVATRPFYERLVAEGFLRKCIPVSVGGDCAPLAAFALTEPGGSANVGSPSPGEGVRTTARRVGDSWVISGRKQWISAATGWNGQGADLLTVVCRTDANVEHLDHRCASSRQRPDF